MWFRNELSSLAEVPLYMNGVPNLYHILIQFRHGQMLQMFTVFKIKYKLLHFWIHKPINQWKTFKVSLKNKCLVSHNIFTTKIASGNIYKSTSQSFPFWIAHPMVFKLKANNSGDCIPQSSTIRIFNHSICFKIYHIKTVGQRRQHWFHTDTQTRKSVSQVSSYEGDIRIYNNCLPHKLLWNKLWASLEQCLSEPAPQLQCSSVFHMAFYHK